MIYTHKYFVTLLWTKVKRSIITVIHYQHQSADTSTHYRLQASEHDYMIGVLGHDSAL